MRRVPWVIARSPLLWFVFVRMNANRCVRDPGKQCDR